MEYMGYLEECGIDVIRGWAMCPEAAYEPVSVDIYASEVLLATIVAEEFREDLLQAGIGTGWHGFTYRVPRFLKNAGHHMVSARIGGQPIELNNSPLAFDASAHQMLKRKALSLAYVQGSGIEIGALHNPLWVSEHAEVRYVDRMQVDELRLQYPELNDLDLVTVDIVDDGEVLSTIDDGSLDFIICNHMLEHSENPLGTLRNHLRKLRPAGIIYCAIPDKRFTFDRARELTSFEHLVEDDRHGPAGSRAQHFLEWASFVNGAEGDAAQERARFLEAMDYSIHFHVWDSPSFMSFLSLARDYLDQSFEVEHLERNGEELIAILSRS
ncbi:Methyltransferase domain protein [compost metagenome]